MIAVEHEHVARFRDLRDGVDLLTVVRDRHDVRIGRQVVIPEVVAQRLKVPDPLARLCVKGDRAVGKEILAVAVAAVKVERRRPESCEHEATARRRR